MTEAAKEPGPLAKPLAWDWVSEGYEKYTRDFLGKFSEVGLERLVLSEKDRLLDVACGPGTTSLLAAEQVKEVVGLDFSEEMIAQFSSNVKARGLDNVSLQVGDGQDLPFGDESFDAAVSMFGLMFFPDRVKGMKELFRVLRPGGRALISSWAPVDQSPLMEALLDALRAAKPEMQAPTYNIESLENRDLFEREMSEAGFRDVRIEPVKCNYSFTSGGALWDEIVEGTVPVVLMRRASSEEEWARVSRICREHLERELSGLTELGSTAYLAVGAKD